MVLGLLRCYDYKINVYNIAIDDLIRRCADFFNFGCCFCSKLMWFWLCSKIKLKKTVSNINVVARMNWNFYVTKILSKRSYTLTVLFYFLNYNNKIRISLISALLDSSQHSLILKGRWDVLIFIKHNSVKNNILIWYFIFIFWEREKKLSDILFVLGKRSHISLSAIA